MLRGPQQLRVEDVEPPSAPAPGEVLIAPVVGGICGTDLQLFRGGPRAGDEQILGHEVAAEVLEVGSGVKGLAAGDRVAVIPIVACGECEMCRSGVGELCLEHESFGIKHAWGGFGERALARASQLVALPEGLSWDQGALIEPLCVASTGVTRGGLRPGGRLLIVGGGPIGVLAAMHAEAAGAGQILVCEPSPERAQRVASLGFEAVDPIAVDVPELCRERSGGLGFDVAVDCAGNQAAFDTAFESVRPTGTVSVVAIHHAPLQVNAERVLHRGLTIAGAVAYPLWAWSRRAEQIASGRIAVERVVTARVPLAEADGMLAGLAGAYAGNLKVLIDVVGR